MPFHFDLVTGIMTLVPLVLSLTVHEWAHAWSAYKLGDDTAERMGRLTLNPLAHIDPIGTILLPILGIPFGWAKPVPVNPARFNRRFSMSAGMAITAAAGPISNFVLATLALLIFALMYRHQASFDPDSAIPVLLLKMFEINIGLGVFNLLPIPPLDGSRLVDHFLPYRMRDTWANVSRFAPFALLAVIVFGGVVIAVPMQVAGGLITKLVSTIVG